MVLAGEDAGSLDELIDRALPNPDDECDADDPDAPNFLKFARVSLRLARASAAAGVPPPTLLRLRSLEAAEHAAWAMFRSTAELRAELSLQLDRLLRYFDGPAAQSLLDELAATIARLGVPLARRSQQGAASRDDRRSALPAPNAVRISP